MRALRPALLVFAVSLLGVSFAPAPAVDAGAGVKGGFVVTCAYSHTAQDDPIVYPGQPGAAHSHDFFGNALTEASSTYQSMVGSASTCSVPQDTAGYWVPSPSIGGSAFHPSGRVGDLRIYYRSAGGRTVDTIPAGLEMIGGDKAAVAPPPLWELRWYCGAGQNGTTPFSSHPYDCSPYAQQFPFVDGVVAIVDMPRCWDGLGILPGEVVYPKNGSGTVCPYGFTHLLPLVSERVHFGIMDPCAGASPCGPTDPDTNVRLTVSTGSGTTASPSGPYYTLHADFWNTWQQDTLDALVADCLNSHVPCDFLGARYPLSTEVSGSGAGSVTTEPSNGACRGSCATTFPTATHVSLTATPDPGSVFAGWGGDCTGTGSCTVAMERAHHVSATFETTSTPYTISVTRQGSGGVSSAPGGIDCGRHCSSQYGSGATVTLRATAWPGWIFDGWGDACSGTGVCVLHVLSDVHVSAAFVPVRHRPDLQIRPAHVSAFSGAGVVGRGGQGASARLRPGGRAKFVLRLVNTGNVPDRFRLGGPGDRGSFRVWYVLPSREGITRRVLSRRYETSVLPPGAARSVLLLVDVSRRTRPGTVGSWLLRAWSAAKRWSHDAVEAKVLVARS